MGYTTDFSGTFTVEPPLNEKEIEFLNKFNQTRRMDRGKGPYYVNGTGDHGQDHEPDIKDYNHPPTDQPGLWCQWMPTKDGDGLEWDGGEKFYHAEEWMAYLIEHFIGANPRAKDALPFLQGHNVNGIIQASGEEHGDHWQITVKDGHVTRQDGHVSYV